MKLDEEYPEVWNIAGDKKIPKSKLAKALFKLLWKILNCENLSLVLSRSHHENL